MGVAERVWAALTSMIKLEDKVVRQGEVIKSQQTKIENLTDQSSDDGSGTLETTNRSSPIRTAEIGVFKLRSVVSLRSMVSGKSSP